MRALVARRATRCAPATNSSERISADSSTSIAGNTVAGVGTSNGSGVAVLVGMFRPRFPVGACGGATLVTPFADFTRYL